MKNMSFALTTAQFRNCSKTVTRRLGWPNLKPGEVFMGVVKGQGIPKGGHVEKMHPARCISNRPEPLNAITPEEVEKEGFPGKSPAWFVSMFCTHNGCNPQDTVNRIEMEHLMRGET